MILNNILASILIFHRCESIYAAFFSSHISTSHRCQRCAIDNKSSLSRLKMNHKDNERARLERNLEDMMGDDWRVFRAKLVAQEQLEAQKIIYDSASDVNTNDEKRDDLSGFLTNTISSIISPMMQDQSHMQNFDEIGDSQCEDPFATPDEIFAVRHPLVTIDKHRWAHPISHIEPGCVLVANEKLGGIFHQTVVLVIEHNDALGTTGLIINRPFPGNLLKVSSETVSNVDLSLKLAFNDAPVSYGGPVMTEDYSILHGYGEVDGSKKVAHGVFVGGSKELINEVRKNNFKSSDALFLKGHTSWFPYQLSREAAKGVWYVASVSPDFILRYAGAPKSKNDNLDDLWSDILICMGGEYAEVVKQNSGSGDARMMTLN